MNHKLNKYINNKLANKKWLPNKTPNKRPYDFINTIPCYDEYDYIFKTLTKAFNSGILGYVGEGSVLELFLQKETLHNQPLVRSKGEQREWRIRKQFGEDLDD